MSFQLVLFEDIVRMTVNSPNDHQKQQILCHQGSSGKPWCLEFNHFLTLSSEIKLIQNGPGPQAKKKIKKYGFNINQVFS